ncbi:MAG: MFS transporter, partial [Methanosarcinaceae archaeon]|nr:MFS transporter [Methanosarcinaceae archaeon]
MTEQISEKTGGQIPEENSGQISGKNGGPIPGNDSGQIPGKNAGQENMTLSHRLKRREKTAILFAVSVATFIVPFASSMTNLSLPMIGEEFGVSTESLGWVSTAYLFMTSMTLMPLSRFSDIAGRKKIFLAGSFIMLLSLVFCFLAPSYHVFIAARMASGI